MKLSVIETKAINKKKHFKIRNFKALKVGTEYYLNFFLNYLKIFMKFL